jgi:DNA-binding IclR family transcriptional regulator
VLVAWLPEAAREILLAAPLEQRTERSITDPQRMRSQLAEITTRGYAQTVEELEQGLNAVAAPIRRADGQVAAAVSVAGPAFRMRPGELPRIARLAMDAASAISRRMGHTERRQSVAR